MITTVTNWRSKSLEWQRLKSWCKRLLVCHTFIAFFPFHQKSQSFVTITLSEWVFTEFVLPTVHVVYDLLSFLYTESKDGTKSKGRKGAKNSATAAKVALMKLKLHAAGDKGLPQVFSLIIVLKYSKMFKQFPTWSVVMRWAEIV